MNLPNQLTTLRILLTPVFVWLTISDSPVLRLAGIIVFVIASLTDLYDGYHARKYGIVTRWGAFMDPLADKILISSAFLLFVWLGYLELWLVMIVIGRDILVTLLRIYAEYKNKPVITSFSAKAKTVLQNAFAYLLLVFLMLQEKTFFGDGVAAFAHAALTSKVTYGVMCFVSGVTLYTGYAYVVENWASIKLLYFENVSDT
jgi:CDP-diacylglycerol--glycerol-3-phosphate 3-phosphatidyltransferase